MVCHRVKRNRSIAGADQHQIMCLQETRSGVNEHKSTCSSFMSFLFYPGTRALTDAFFPFMCYQYIQSCTQNSDWNLTVYNTFTFKQRDRVALWTDQ